MAHWIIEDHGFGGTTYTCSRCRDSWNDIYRDVSAEDNCPTCGYPMNDENEYVEQKKSVKFPKISFIPTSETETIRKYEEQIVNLVKVSGYKIDELIERFAAGYTLQPPETDDIKQLEATIRYWYKK